MAKCALCNMAGADDSKNGIGIHRRCWFNSVRLIGGEKTLEKMLENLDVKKFVEGRPIK